LWLLLICTILLLLPLLLLLPTSQGNIAPVLAPSLPSQQRSCIQHFSANSRQQLLLRRAIATAPHLLYCCSVPYSACNTSPTWVCPC
jgi:hypothetical protein